MRASELPAKPSRSVFTMGMAPPTAASKLRATWFFSAMAANAMPCLASKALLAVTTGFFALSAAETAVRARSPSPPLHSPNTANSADQFHEHVDLAICRECHGIGNPAQLPATNVSFLAARARGHGDDFDGTAATRGKRIALALDEPGDARADRAQTGNTEFQWN